MNREAKLRYGLETMCDRVVKRHRGWPLILVAVLVAVLFAGVHGCAKPLPPEPAAANGERLWPVHRARVEMVSAWRFEGKVSIRHDDRLWRGGIRWLHDRHRDNMDFLSPGGRPLMRLKGSPDGAEARDSKGRVYRAATFEELVAEVLGVEVPTSSLRYWVTGVPDPTIEVEGLRVRRSGYVEELSQRGWQVRYLDYQSSSSLSLRSLELPTRLALVREDLKITLVASRWKLIRFSDEAKKAI